MTCQYFQTLLDDYIDDIDGVLSATEKENMEKHLRECSPCREEWERAQRLQRVLSRLPFPDPGDEYWKEATTLILAKSVDYLPCSRQKVSPSSYPSQGTGKRGFLQAVASLAVSLFILFSALLIGSGQQRQISRQTTDEMPVFATASVNDLLRERFHGPAITKEEQLQLAEGMLLMGPPSFLGRFALFPEITDSP